MGTGGPGWLVGISGFVALFIIPQGDELTDVFAGEDFYWSAVS